MRSPKLHVRRSPVHGKGIFAAEPIAAGTRVIEYKGQRISAVEALRRTPDDLRQEHTFQFALSDGSIIDGGTHGNDARFINHACAPNCVALETDGRLALHAARDVDTGEELTYDYALTSTRRMTPALRRNHACCCGAPDCRGTLLSQRRPKRGRRATPPAGERVVVKLRGGLGQNLVQMVAGHVLAQQLTQRHGREHACEILVPDAVDPLTPPSPFEALGGHLRNDWPALRQHSDAGLFAGHDLPAIFPHLQWRSLDDKTPPRAAQDMARFLVDAHFASAAVAKRSAQVQRTETPGVVTYLNSHSVLCDAPLAWMERAAECPKLAQHFAPAPAMVSYLHSAYGIRPEDTLVGVQVNEAQGASDVSWMRECLRQALAPAPSAKVVLVGKPSTSLQDLAKALEVRLSADLPRRVSIGLAVCEPTYVQFFLLQRCTYLVSHPSRFWQMAAVTSARWLKTYAPQVTAATCEVGTARGGARSIIL